MMTLKGSIIPKVFLSFLLFEIGLNCCHAVYRQEIIPIREERYRVEIFLPLDSLKADSVMNFVKRNGSWNRPPVIMSSQSEHFQRFLAVLQDSTHLVRGVFDTLSGVREFINTSNYSNEVYDAREPEGPDQYDRFAYHWGGYWLIFKIDPRDIANPDLEDLSKRFYRLTVIRDFGTSKGRK